MIEDKLFEDCNRIADKYETNLITVLMQYTNIESKALKQMIKVPYEVLIHRYRNLFQE